MAPALREDVVAKFKAAATEPFAYHRERRDGTFFEMRGRPLHAWLTLPEPWRARDFAAEAEALGVRITPADAFVSGRAEAPHAVRPCRATSSTART